MTASSNVVNRTLPFKLKEVRNLARVVTPFCTKIVDTLSSIKIMIVTFKERASSVLMIVEEYKAVTLHSTIKSGLIASLSLLQTMAW